MTAGTNTIANIVNVQAGTIVGDVTINYSASENLNLPAGLRITGNLIVNAPNSTVNNSSTVTGDITIEDISDNTWNELARTNSIVFKAAGKTLVIKGGLRKLDIKVPTDLVTRRQLKNVTIDKDIKVTVRPTVSSTRTKEVIGGSEGQAQTPIEITPPIDLTAVQDNLAIGKAKTNIESATYVVNQKEVTNSETALVEAQKLVNELELEGTTAKIVAGDFTAATTGDDGTPDGIPGLYTFTVIIDKGKGIQVISVEQTMTIIATTYEEELIKKINKGSTDIMSVSVYESAGITGFSDRLLGEIYDYWEYQGDDLLQRIIQIGRYKKGWADLTKAEIQDYVTLLSELFKYDMYTEGHIRGNDTAVGTDVTDRALVLYQGETADADIEIEFAKYDGPIHEWYEDYNTHTPNVIEIINNRIVIKELISYREESYTEDTIPVYLRLKKNNLMIEWVIEIYIERQGQ